MNSLSKRRGSWVVCAGLALAFSQSCSKENNVESNQVTIGDVCGPKVACADGSCAFGFCRNPCKDDSDCANTGVCLSDGQTKGCRLPTESKCSASDPCPAGLSCADDGSCRTPCDDDRPCDIEGQMCVEGACTMEEVTNAGGTGGKGGTAGSSGSGSGGKAGASSGGMSGSGGSGNVGGAEGGETSIGGEGGAPIVATCGALGQDCCASGSACAAGLGLACGQGSKCGCDLGMDDCENGAADGCESALSADEDNCGACGHACGGGECIAGICQAELLVKSGTLDGEAFTNQWDPAGGYQRSFTPFDASGFVLPSTHQASGNYGMRAFDKDGAKGNFLTVPQTEPIKVAYGPWITSSGVFWADGDDPKLLRRVSRSNTTVTTPVSVVSSLYARVIDGDFYYQDGTNLSKIPAGSLTPQTLYTTLNGPPGYAVSGTEVFTWGGSYQLMRGTSGAPLAVEYAALLPTMCPPAGLIADATSVFAYGECSDEPEGYIVRYDYTGTPQGGTRQVILKDIPAIKTVTYVTLIGNYIYFVDNGGPYKLYRLLRTGGTPELLMSNGPFYGLNHDADYIYTWMTGGLSRIRIPL